MNIVKCPNNHFYDSDRFSSCPHCENVTPINPGITQSASELEINKTMRLVPDQPATGGKVVIPTEPSPDPIGGGANPNGPDVEIPYGSPERGVITPTKPEDSTGDKTIRYFDAIDAEPVTGWLVCIEGKKNFGKDFKLKVGGNFIGRASEMDVCLAGDSSVSRLKHAVVLYEPKNNIFILQPGESRQLTYLNENVVLSPTEIKTNDIIQVGDTKLLFIPCCTDKFKWDDVIKEGEENNG